MFKGIAQHQGGGCMMVVRRQEDQGVGFVGTGFLCHSKGYILTCAHSINLTDKLALISPQPLNEFNPLTLNRVKTIDVKVVQYDQKNDVALLKIVTPVPLTIPPNLLGNENISQVGSTVCYLGFSFGQSGLHTLKVSQSIISSKVKSQNGTKQFQLDAMVHKGDSGGPLVDLQSGKIIGIVSGRFSPAGNGGSVKTGSDSLGTENSISYATSINYAINLMKTEGLIV